MRTKYIEVRKIGGKNKIYKGMNDGPVDWTWEADLLVIRQGYREERFYGNYVYYNVIIPKTSISEILLPCKENGDLLEDE